MSGSSRYSRAISANVEEIDRRLRLLEQNLEKIGARASTNAGETAEGLVDAIASALAGVGRPLTAKRQRARQSIREPWRGSLRGYCQARKCRAAPALR